MKTAAPARLPANNFDFLRFAFASLVVLSHSYPLATGTEAQEPLALATRGQLTFGALAVDCFFIISGFLILHSWLSNPTPVDYLRKRVLRIYPAFLVVAVIDAFIVAPLFSTAGFTAVGSDFVTRFVLEALRLDATVPGPAFAANPAPGTVNGSLWSISYEFWCYLGILGLGLCGWASHRRFLLIGLLATILISFVFAWQQLTPGGRLLGQIFGYPPIWARLLPYFVVGMAFYAWREQIRITRLGVGLAVVALIVGALTPNGMIFVLPFAAAYLIFGFAFLQVPHLSRFAKRGDFSYGIYLYSFPILQIVVAVAGRPFEPIALFLIAWPISIVAAMASWHLVEKHCIRRASRRAVVASTPIREIV
jgi:peptidoglycan/LPS O-acetylase OafA/YrhL